MRSPEWLGFRGKTLWDWLQLLIVPAILIGVTFAWTASQTGTDDRREDRRSQDATLQAYFDQMSGLMLHENLLTSRKKNDAVRSVARTVTLATLRRLDGERKAEVVSFLYEAGVLHAPHQLTFFGSVVNDRVFPIIDLEGADLRGVDFANASLSTTTCGLSKVPSRAVLTGDFRGARFDHADLCAVNLSGADLRGASFEGAGISHSTLSFADQLQGASFKGASLFDVDLSCANLDGVVFDDAAILPGTTFGNAHLDNTSFVRARFNVLRAGVPFHGKTSFAWAEGRGVDFRDAVNLSTLDVSDATFRDVRLDGAKGRPKDWGPGPLHPEKRSQPDIVPC